MKGQYQTVCDECRTGFGWHGEFKDRPRCPRCGFLPNLSQLSEDAIESELIFMMIRTHPKDADGETLKAMRKFAGYGMRQAGELLNLDPFSTICRYEDGTLSVPADVADRMEQLYGCGETNVHRSA